jgi:hypothetical protein
MKLNNAVSGELVGENIGASTAFGFEVNAKAFRLLSDNIYKDKIGSIVRELSCNAFDAHKQAGNEKEPFFIHLPTSFERYFSIRDYGIGLDKPDVLTIYSTYFKSTKDNSNDMIGAFGLGSKTPFSYTDTFTVKSFFNGKLYIFVAMVDSDGVPVLTEIGTEDTTERNGLEISFAVENYSAFDQFSRACDDQLRFFDVKPTLNVGKVKENDCTVVNDYGSLKTLENGDGVYIKIGQVGYAVSRYDARQTLGDDYSAFFDIFPDVLIDAGIGNVEVTVSRESIAFSKKTVKFLQKLIDEKKKIIFAEIEQNWNTAGNDFERIKLLENFSKPTKITKLLNLKFDNDKIETLTGGFFYTMLLASNNQIGVVAESKKTTSGIQVKYDSAPIIQLSSKNAYVQYGHVKYYRWRLKALKDATENNVYVIDMEDPKIVENMSFFGMLPLVQADTLPLPADFATRKKSMRPTYWTTRLCHINEHSLNDSERNYDDFDDDILSDKVYILRDYSGGYTCKWSHDLLRALEKDNILSSVCSIRPSDYDAIKDLSNYISLDSLIEKKISELQGDKIKEIIKISKNLQVLHAISYTINESVMNSFCELSKSNLAKTVKNITTKLENRIAMLVARKDNLSRTLSNMERVLINDGAAQYVTENYSSIVDKYIDKCFKQHAKQIAAINFLKSRMYYDNDAIPYIVTLIDAELNAASPA